MSIFTGNNLINERYTPLKNSAHSASNYDPELLYVECRNCGRPIIWEPGKTTALLAEADIKIDKINAECLLLADTCPTCVPDLQAVKIQVVRLGDIDADALKDDALFLQDCAGNA